MKHAVMPPSASPLEIRGLAKSYSGFTLSDVNFDVPLGYIVGLIGPNGAGKTTIIKSILRSVIPDRGTICLFGEDTMHGEAIARSRIGFVHEAPPLYRHLTVLEYGRLIGRFYPRWDEGEYKRRISDYELPPGKKVASLSRGMKMKLSLATAMSHEADLLILDEPTSGLDPIFRRELLDELRTFIEGGDRSVLFSTHITSDLERIADYIVYIRNGRIRLNESVESIRDTWRLVRGGVEDLTDELRPYLEAVSLERYSFTAITSNPAAVNAVSERPLSFENVTFDDIVVFLEAEHA